LRILHRRQRLEHRARHIHISPRARVIVITNATATTARVIVVVETMTGVGVETIILVGPNGDGVECRAQRRGASRAFAYRARARGARVVGVVSDAPRDAHGDDVVVVGGIRAHRTLARRGESARGLDDENGYGV
jgi:hypothetical protein